MITSTDSILWYHIGVFGEAGFAVPNPSDDPTSLNDNIADLVSLIGRNLFAVTKSEDTDLRTPPSVNTLMRVHRLYVRSAQILQGRAVPPGEPNFEKQHISPSREGFLVYPVPYFKVRNPFLKRWAKIILELLSEMMQHTENRKSVEISTDFAGLVGAYLKRIYVNMAVELFGKTRDDASSDGFQLSDEDFANYNPSQYFTSTELIDTVAPQRFVFTEDQLKSLSDGILVTDLPELRPWPGTVAVRADRGIRPQRPAASAGPSFPPPPGP